MSKNRKGSKAEVLLNKLNREYLLVHRKYEKFFWQSYMGDHSIDKKFEKAQEEREAFRSNEDYKNEVDQMIAVVSGTEKSKLAQWAWFFSKYQTPNEVKAIFSKIVKLEKQILKKQATRKEGYINPTTKKFVRASRAQMSDLVATHDDESIRKACFEALEGLALGFTKEYLKLVKLRNQYAYKLGYSDFYEYKIRTEEDMSKEELFDIFNKIFEKTKYAFDDLRKMEEKNPALKKPWNRAYILSGDFTKESDQYFPFEDALNRWGTSFHRLGINYQGGQLQLDLLDRKGKYENGFCHWPELVHFKNGKRQPGAANFTCNVVFGQVGSSEDGYNTLFHEGGHAAHLLNTEQTETCVNNEYPPASTAWDETQSMFLDSVLSSIEWTTRYAKNKNGEPYPFELFEKEVRKLHKLNPLAMNGISSVMEFEKQIYESKNLTEADIIRTAKRVYRKYTGNKYGSVRLLSVPHIYSWESACSYQGYGLAQLAVAQWRKYFYKKFGYIVDNPKVGKEMKKVWSYGSALTFPECVKKATGHSLSPDAYIESITAPLPKILKKAKEKISRLEKVNASKRKIELNAEIKMVHGKKTIATNKKGFEDMSKVYSKWLNTQRIKSN